MGGIPAGIARKKAAQQERKAALEAQEQMLGAIDEERDRLEGSFGELQGLNETLSRQASGQLGDNFTAAQLNLGDSGRRAMGHLSQGLSGEVGALQTGFGEARNLLGEAAGRDRFSAGDLDLSSFETSPGFEFRRSQGEGAINRLASARGGRLSGRTLQELSRFNQGLAADEFDKFRAQKLAEREQNITTGLAGQESLDQLAQSRADVAAQAGEAIGGAQSAGQAALAETALGIGQNLADLSVGRGQALAGLTQDQLSNALGLGTTQNQLSAGLLGATTQAIQAPLATAGGANRATAETGEQASLTNFAKDIL